MSIRFLTLERTLEVHRELIERYGGDPGVRDIGLLQSALAQPMSMFGGEYLHQDVAEMAAAYIYHLAMNHAFIDGNKRVAAAAGLLFLRVNNIKHSIPEVEMEDVVLRTARSELEKPQIAEFLRRHLQGQ